MDTDISISLSEAVLALHVLGWAVWLGVVVAIAVFGTRVRARGDANAIVAFVADAGFVGLTVVLPAALLVVVSGGWLAVDADLDFGDTWWLPACMSLWLVAMLGSTAVRPPQALKMTTLAKEHGVEEEDVQWRARRVLLLARGEALLVAVALTLFVIRPG